GWWCSRNGRPVAEVAGQELKARHAHGDAHLDLVADDAAVDVVGDLAVDLDAAVHRPRMHDEGVGLGDGELVVVEAEEMKILACRRDEAAMHALGLQTQHHDDVDVLEAALHVVEDLDAEPLGLGGEEGARRDEADARPMMLRSWMLERATRLCRMSPQMATTRPLSEPLRRRMVSASSSAWVGCSWLPSPALMTAQLTFSERSCTAPDSGWRTISTSGCMAFSVIAVSIIVSPFLIELPLTDMLMTSPPSRLPASSNEVRVRVEFSKKRLMIVRPRIAERFLSAWRLGSTWLSARSRIVVISSGENPSMPRRCRCRKRGVAAAEVIGPRI